MKKCYKKKIIFKLLLVFIIFNLNVHFSYSQLRPIEVILKKGDTLVGIGKLKSDTVKFKVKRKTKAKFIEFSKIKSVEIYFESIGDKTYDFFILDYSNKIIPVERLFLGEKASLYFLEKNGQSLVGAPTGFKMITTTYYAKKKEDTVLTELGNYLTSAQKLKIDVRTFFRDCELMMKKMDAGEFKRISDIEKMFTFYNKEC